MNLRTLNLLNLIGFIIMVGVNILANVLPIAGRTTGDVSEFTDNLFVPAGFTFSIWGVIYLLLGFFCVSAFLRADKPTTSKSISEIGYLFLFSCLINATWIFAWHYLEIGIAMVLMIALLITLLTIYVRLEKADIPIGSYERYSVQLPFQVYAGWISVATIANMAAMLTFYEFGGFGIDPQIWASVMIVIAGFLGILILFKFNDFAYPAVIAWALFGIYNKRVSVTNANDGTVELVAVAVLAIVLLSMVFKFVRKKI